MDFTTIGGRRYARFDRLGAERGLIHAFSMRPLDVSMRKDALAPQRRENRARFCVDWGVDPAALHACLQVHDTQIAAVRGDSPAVLEGVDGAIAAGLGVGLMSFSADCPLVLVYDPAAPAVGVAHASWRCTVAQISAALVRRLCGELGARPERMLAGVGPGAGPCCYEVKDDVWDAAAALPDRDALFRRDGGRMTFDLWAANAAQLAAAGVPHDRIETAGVCTMCRNAEFFSFRREGAGCGHFGLLAALASR